MFTGKTALHWAVAVNSLEVTKELLRSGAKKDQPDDKVYNIPCIVMKNLNNGKSAMVVGCGYKDELNYRWG